MKAYLIARVSTEDQEEALPAQVYRLQDYAEREFEESELFKIKESAYKEGRKQFSEIISRVVREEQLIAVVFDKIDRYSRDVSADETRALRKLCQAGAIELHFISDHLRMTENSSAQEWFMLGIGETSAELYSRSTSDNVKRRFQQKLRDGTILGPAPFGYKNVALNRNANWVEVDTYQAEVVRSIFEWYATGVNSLKTIRKKVIDEYGITLASSKIEYILKNPFYSGQMLYKGKLYPHKYEVIIDEALAERVKAVREGYHVKPTIYAGLPYTYRGLITCAECGRRVTFEKKKNKYVYGHCTQTNGKHGAPYVPEDYFTAKIKESIASIQIPEDVYLEVSAALKEESAEALKNHKQALSLIEAEIGKFKQRIELLYEDRLDRKIPEELYEKKMQEYSTALENLKKRRNNFELVAKHDYSAIDNLLRLAKNAPKIFEKANIEQKRSLIKLIH